MINGTLRTLLLAALIGAPTARADTVSQGFTVNASIIKGCVLGSGVTNVTSFGSMSFGRGVLEQPDKNRLQRRRRLHFDPLQSRAQRHPD